MHFLVETDFLNLVVQQQLKVCRHSHMLYFQNMARRSFLFCVKKWCMLVSAQVDHEIVIFMATLEGSAVFLLTSSFAKNRSASSKRLCGYFVALEREQRKMQQYRGQPKYFQKQCIYLKHFVRANQN